MGGVVVSVGDIDQFLQGAQVLSFKHSMGETVVRLSAVVAMTTTETNGRYEVKMILSCGERLVGNGDRAFAEEALRLFRESLRVAGSPAT